jgi:hypothetical protein
MDVFVLGEHHLYGRAPDLRPPAGQDRRRQGCVVCVLIEAAGQALIWLAPWPTLALFGAAVTGFGYSLVYPGFGVEATREPRPRHGSLHCFSRFGAGIRQPRAGFGSERSRLERGLPRQYAGRALRCDYRSTAPKCAVVQNENKELRLWVVTSKEKSSSLMGFGNERFGNERYYRSGRLCSKSGTTSGNYFVRQRS